MNRTGQVCLTHFWINSANHPTKPVSSCLKIKSILAFLMEFYDSPVHMTEVGATDDMVSFPGACKFGQIFCAMKGTPNSQNTQREKEREREREMYDKRVKSAMFTLYKY